MNLIEEAVIVELFGIKVYAFGLYVMLGAFCAMIVIFLLGKVFHLKPGSAPLTALFAMVFGLVFSRLVFCLLNQELGMMTPLHAWFRADGGGWSIFGLIGGVFFGGWLSALIAKESVRSTLEILSLAVLPVIIAERLGESRIEDFDISRPLDSRFLSGSFLATGGDDPCLATYYVAAFVALLLFIFLCLRLPGRSRDGETAISFMLLFGAASVVTESLRYDRFLSISFVGLQQIIAAVMLTAGVILAVREYGKGRSRISAAALISLPLMVGIVLALEFALDRTTWNKTLLYVCMIATVSVPAVLGLKLMGSVGKGKSDP